MPVVSDSYAVGQREHTREQIIFSQQPFRENVLVVEILFFWFSSTNEATVALANVTKESACAEEYDFTVLIDDRAVTGFRPCHSLVPQ
jgi:hypothetical protein